MRKVAFAVSVVTAVGVVACTVRAREPQAGEPRMQSAALEDARGCNNGKTVEVDPNDARNPLDGGKRFQPPPGWRLCDGSQLTLKNDLPSQVCANIQVFGGGIIDGGMGSMSADGGTWTSPSLRKGLYTVGVCIQTDCDAACDDMTDAANMPEGIDHPDTIKGNLTVSSGGGTEE